jgi:hypothetical protein
MIYLSYPAKPPRPNPHGRGALSFLNTSLFASCTWASNELGKILCSLGVAGVLVDDPERQVRSPVEHLEMVVGRKLWNRRHRAGGELVERHAHGAQLDDRAGVFGARRRVDLQRQRGEIAVVVLGEPLVGRVRLRSARPRCRSAKR